MIKTPVINDQDLLNDQNLLSVTLSARRPGLLIDQNRGRHFQAVPSSALNCRKLKQRIYELL
jgi:hypothetical protein